MRAFRYIVLTATLTLGGASAARPDDKKALVPGDPPLTQDMVDDYCKMADWRFGPLLAKAGGVDRLRQMVINDWKNGDASRQKAVLADLKWWRDDYPKLSPAERDLLSAKAPPPGPSPRDADAIHMLKLQQGHDAQQLQIRALSNAQAKHHETMMIIINNMRPAGRYEYNPATGRYDQWVP
ncbi:MAG TPA: hypothetical protein VKE40_09530 [Gemmataceae bacterium]|nr:hypothetical protein [Gemmataceae bacterium]